MNRLLNPDLDLSVSRIIKAPRQAVWRAWTTPERFEQWWIPKPTKCKVVAMDLKPGGSFVTQMSDNGEAFQPHVTGCFLAVDEMERIVFTDTLLGGWRPAEQSFLTAIISFKDHADGTDYTAYAMHRNQADRENHEKMGFHDGWSTVTRQLAELVER